MPGQDRMTCSDTTALQESLETAWDDSAEWDDAAEMMPERGTVRGSVKTAATVRPTEREIAIVAYLLWLKEGRPDGTEREDWFRAEAILKAALAEQCESLSQPPSISRRETRTGYDILAEFRVEGHWEVWESEWSGARWVCDSGPTGM
jgi:hypothetical protein